jgi:hypothetical protein
MLKFSTSNIAPIQIDVGLTPPAVYLDYSVIADLATELDELGRRFLEALDRENGTLYLSWAHVIELFALGQGPTFKRIAQYLEAFGPRFVVIDSDPNTVIEREKTWVPGRQNPAVDEDFVRLLAANWDGRAAISFGILIDLMAKEAEFFKNIKELHSEHKVKLKELFDRERTRHLNDENAKKMLDCAQYFRIPRGAITYKIQMELMRESVRTNEVFNASDGMDFFHAVVGLSYCTHAVFDKKWARRCRKLTLPERAAVVFDGTEVESVIMAVKSFHSAPKAIY